MSNKNSESTFNPGDYIQLGLTPGIVAEVWGERAFIIRDYKTEVVLVEQKELSPYTVCHFSPREFVPRMQRALEKYKEKHLGDLVTYRGKLAIIVSFGQHYVEILNHQRDIERVEPDILQCPEIAFESNPLWQQDYAKLISRYVGTVSSMFKRAAHNEEMSKGQPHFLGYSPISSKPPRILRKDTWRSYRED